MDELDFGPALDGGKPAADGSKDSGEPKPAGELELLRRESAGKDRKITELSRRIAELEAGKAEAGKVTADWAERLSRLAEKAGELRALEGTLREREAALNFAIEKGIPVNLALGNASRLETFQAEVDELADQIARGLVAKAGGPKDGRIAGLTAEKGSGLSLAHFGRGKSSVQLIRELSRLPDATLDRLERQQAGGEAERVPPDLLAKPVIGSPQTGGGRQIGKGE